MNPIETVHLGRTEVVLTRLGFGTASIGGLLGAVSAESAAAALDEALASGLMLFDTAPGYGYGLAEERLGRALGAAPGRERVVSTKVGRLLRPRTSSDPEDTLFEGAPPLIDVFDFSYDAVMRSFEGSLARLGVDRVEIVHVHDPEHRGEQTLTGAYRALTTLREEGSIRAIGLGTTRCEELVRAAREDPVDCLLVAGRYTLLDQSGLVDLLPLCEERGIGVIIGGVFNSGIAADVRAESTYEYRRVEPATLDRVRRIDDVCRRYGVSARAAALQFPFGSAAVCAVIPGMRSRSEVAENVAAFRTVIPADLWNELKSLGLLAPEAPTP
jgi:D-threo-aldose 1-dehydrogenase